MASESKASNLVGWLVACLLAFVFLDVGYGKSVNQRVYVQEFAIIGIGQWFRYFVGVLEVAGAVGVLIPKCRMWAALVLATVMVGATFVNVAILPAPPLALLTIVLLALALVLAWLTQPQRA